MGVFVCKRDASSTLYASRQVRRQKPTYPQSPSTPKPAPPPADLRKKDSKKKKKKKNWLGNLKKFVFRRHDSSEKDEAAPAPLRVVKSDADDEDDDDFIELNAYPLTPKNPPRGWDDPVVISLYEFLRRELIQTIKSVCITNVESSHILQCNCSFRQTERCMYGGIKKKKDLEKNNHKIECGIELAKVVEEEALSQNDTRDCALTLAAIRIDSSMALERIVVAGMFVDETIFEKQHCTMLHLAIEHGDYVNTVQVLLEAGVNVDAVDATGTTPLFLAVKLKRKRDTQIIDSCRCRCT